MTETDLSSRARVRRIVRRTLVFAAAFLSAGAFAAPTALAENSLVSSNPADNESLTASPTSMVFTFSEPLGGTNSVAVTCEGAPFSVGQTTVGPDGLTITVPVPNPMPKGTCSAAVAVSAPDGSPNGQFSVKFTITSDSVAAVTTLAPTVTVDPAAPVDPTVTTVAGGVPTTVAPGGTGDSSGDSTGGSGGPLGLARLVTNIGLAVLFGSLVLIATAWPEGVEYILTVRFLRTAWIVSLVGSVLTTVFLTANVTGKSIGASLNPLAWTDLDSASGIAAIARVLLTAGCIWVVMRPERCIDQSTQLPALAAPLLAVATLGFTRTGGDLAAVGVIMGVGHALAMAVWFGGLALLTRVVLAGPGDDDLVHAVRGFSRISTPALLVTVVTGAVQTFRLDRGALFDTGHGRVLLLKAVAVGAMVFVGLATRQFVNAQLRRVDSLSAPLANRLRRATGIEAVAGVVVLAITSWLLSFTPPNLVEASPVGQYGYSAPMVADDLDVTVRLTGVVGRNGLRIEVASPTTGLSNFTVTFIPPAETTAPTVLLTVPAELAGAGVAVLDVAEGVPLEAPGVWTLAIKATTPTGEKTAQKRFTLLGA
jgi:putative copper export protein/methionine-rich copper-binding protein CopC